jgi:aminoglycoside phosphotransferase (APT) family kinase protein
MHQRSAQELGPRLRALLRDRVDPKIDFSVSPRPLTGGAFSAVYQFKLMGAPPEWSTPLILRLVPFAGTQVLIEAALHEGARAAGVPAPAVPLVEPRADLLGVPFLVMVKLPGHGFVRGIQWYRFAQSFPALVVSWPETFARVMALLRAADVAPTIAALERLGIAAEDALTTRHLVWAEEQLGEAPAFAELLAWLKLERPEPPSRLSLVHGDLWPANVLVKGKAITGLVDWTMGAIGDPALDLGFARVGMARMPEPFPPPPPIRNVVHAAGVNVAKRMLEKVASPDFDTDRVAYFEALRCAVELAAVHRGRRLGQPVGWEHGIPALLAHLRTITDIDVRYQ